MSSGTQLVEHTLLLDSNVDAVKDTLKVILKNFNMGHPSYIAPSTIIIGAVSPTGRMKLLKTLAKALKKHLTLLLF